MEIVKRFCIIIIIMLRNPLKVLSRMSQSRPVEDWQYVADIHKHLKAGDYNEALRSVIHVTP